MSTLNFLFFISFVYTKLYILEGTTVETCERMIEVKPAKERGLRMQTEKVTN